LDQLVEQFTTQEPYSKAQRVFVIVDNGSAHPGYDRNTQVSYPNLTPGGNAAGRSGSLEPRSMSVVPRYCQFEGLRWSRRFRPEPSVGERSVPWASRGRRRDSTRTLGPVRG
jgi:hypothetical protein